MNEKIKLVLQSALERADLELAGVKLLDLKSDQPLFGGKGSALDSLNLVAFIFILEDEFKKITGKSVKISTQDILSKEECPFRNLDALGVWLAKKEEVLK
ncbi:MAG: hypothetical protein V4598_13000 [Bdellovibrionota bacterium]